MDPLIVYDKNVQRANQIISMNILISLITYNYNYMYLVYFSPGTARAGRADGDGGRE